VSERRKLVPAFEGREVPLTRACRLLGVSRRRLRYVPKRDDSALVGRLRDLARRYPRFGACQLRRMLLRQGMRVNIKRVRRLCRKHGLLLNQKRRRKRRGIGCGLPCRAEYPNHVWSYDFVEDRTESGRKLRILTVVDEFTRRCVGIEIEHRMNAKLVAGVLLKLFAEHGIPRFLRSDNGSEFIAKFLMRVLAIHGVEARPIDPGSPWQNGIDERFNGTLRDECLNLETFHGRDHARAVIRLFARFYNTQRPHSALGEAVTPQEYYAKWRQADFVGGEDPGLCPGPRDLPLYAPDGEGVTGLAPERGLAGFAPNQPDRPVIHVGAPVASQQSRTLRVDGTSVEETRLAGKVPATDSTS
jgi:putative transposase